MEEHPIGYLPCGSGLFIGIIGLRLVGWLTYRAWSSRLFSSLKGTEFRDFRSLSLDFSGCIFMFLRLIFLRRGAAHELRHFPCHSPWSVCIGHGLASTFAVIAAHALRTIFVRKLAKFGLLGSLDRRPQRRD